MYFTFQTFFNCPITSFFSFVSYILPSHIISCVYRYYPGHQFLLFWCCRHWLSLVYTTKPMSWRLCHFWLFSWTQVFYSCLRVERFFRSTVDIEFWHRTSRSHIVSLVYIGYTKSSYPDLIWHTYLLVYFRESDFGLW